MLLHSARHLPTARVCLRSGPPTFANTSLPVLTTSLTRPLTTTGCSDAPTNLSSSWRHAASNDRRWPFQIPPKFNEIAIIGRTLQSTHAQYRQYRKASSMSGPGASSTALLASNLFSVEGRVAVVTGGGAFLTSLNS